MSIQNTADIRRNTAPDIRARKGREPIVSLTAYHAHTARWLDARRAHYVSGPQSPMGYNFGAQDAPSPGSLDFAALQARVPVPSAPGAP